MSTRYTADIDLANVNDSHTFAIAAAPPGSRVLDVGLADGSVARVLHRLGCRVWGVEIDAGAADLATDVCEDIVVGDVQELDLAAAFPGQVFDVVLLLDVLEHLTHPEAVLRQIGSVLAERGYIVVSLPNVTHAAVRLQLLEGRFAYTPLGLLDDTHVRFFDRPGAEALLSDTGYVVFDRTSVSLPIDQTEIAVDLDTVPRAVLDTIGLDPDATTYQFIFLAAPADSPAAHDPPLLPLRVLQERVRELQAVAEEASRHIARLESELAEVKGLVIHEDPRLGEGLHELRIQSDERRRQLKQLFLDYTEQMARLRELAAGLD